MPFLCGSIVQIHLFFISSFPLHIDHVLSLSYSLINSCLLVLLHIYNPYIKQQRVCRMINTLKPKKSSGCDNISNFIIKRLRPGYLRCLSKCFNEWLQEGITIDDWKVAKIITLNKVKSNTPQCDQTRHISLLSTHSKLFEKILLNRVKNWADSNHIIPLEQSGFRKGCLLQTRVLSIYHEVKNYLAANVPTLSIYIDYKKSIRSCLACRTHYEAISDGNALGVIQVNNKLAE